ncbi:MAG: DEAD/DEAH box helicase [Sphaerochaetaceae bacterium]
MQQLEQFSRLGLSSQTINALVQKGFTAPTPIQEACIPLLLQNEVDVVGKAQTGTGKTAAFALPILEIVEPSVTAVQALILLPTRELALQVASEIDSLQGNRNLSLLAVYGGSSIEMQIRRLNKGVHVVVGTPGRVLDHLKRGTLVFDRLQFVVLDEADEMLNMGFIEEIEAILEKTPADKRMLLFSATMPKPILQLAKRFMRAYEVVETEQKNTPPSLTLQHSYEVREQDKGELLSRIIDMAPSFYGLVFCRTKMQSDEVAATLIQRGYNAEAIHGDLAQRQRELILRKFRQKVITILVATDVAARGIDIQDLTHVINYTIPQNPESYIHRIGRTGRAGKEGIAITFVTPSEQRRFSFIKRIVQSDITSLPIPQVKDVISAKKEAIYQMVNAEQNTQYVSFAHQISAQSDPHVIISTLIDKLWGSQLNPTSYRTIEQRSQRPQLDRGPKEKTHSNQPVRLFIAKGRVHGMTKRLLVDYLKEHAELEDYQIDEVEVMQEFSFVTVPAQKAEHVLLSFSVGSTTEKPLVTRARSDRKQQKSKKTRDFKKRKAEIWFDSPSKKRKRPPKKRR